VLGISRGTPSWFTPLQETGYEARRYCRYLQVPSAPMLQPQHVCVSQISGLCSIKCHSGLPVVGDPGQHLDKENRDTWFQMSSGNGTGDRGCASMPAYGRQRNDVVRCGAPRTGGKSARMVSQEPATASTSRALYAQQMVQREVY
jgi:hypothetical protein